MTGATRIQLRALAFLCAAFLATSFFFPAPRDAAPTPSLSTDFPPPPWKELPRAELDAVVEAWGQATPRQQLAALTAYYPEGRRLSSARGVNGAEATVIGWGPWDEEWPLGKNVVYKPADTEVAGVIHVEAWGALYNPGGESSGTTLNLSFSPAGRFLLVTTGYYESDSFALYEDGNNLLRGANLAIGGNSANVTYAPDDAYALIDSHYGAFGGEGQNGLFIAGWNGEPTELAVRTVPAGQEREDLALPATKITFVQGGFIAETAEGRFLYNLATGEAAEL